MDTVRLARELGDVSGLLPSGISQLRDIPYQLMQSIRAALVFLSFEEMRDEDRPPRSIWTNNELLSEHMDGIKRKYRRDDDGGSLLGSGRTERNDALRMLVAS